MIPAGDRLSTRPQAGGRDLTDPHLAAEPRPVTTRARPSVAASAVELWLRIASDRVPAPLSGARFRLMLSTGGDTRRGRPRWRRGRDGGEGAMDDAKSDLLKLLVVARGIAGGRRRGALRLVLLRLARVRPEDADALAEMTALLHPSDQPRPTPRGRAARRGRAEPAVRRSARQAHRDETAGPPGAAP